MARASSTDLTPWLAFCAEVLPLHASAEERARWGREAEEEEEDFGTLLAAETLPPPAGGAGGGLPQHAQMGTQRYSARNKGALKHARELRNSTTNAEKKLWAVLRGNRMEGFKFRRQQAVGPYIADFLSPLAKLIIELDGGQHAERLAYDEQRTRFLEQAGYRVLRFWNNEVMENVEGVAQVISTALVERTPLQLPPRAGGGSPRTASLTLNTATSRRLKRGQLTPDRTLDLHGLTLPEAFTILSARIAQARADGARLMLVITGKGRGGEGKLRQALPIWLEEPAIRAQVVAASAAHRSHGGAGAFYLLLRKPGGRRP